jgi:hypothetical protein
VIYCTRYLRFPDAYWSKQLHYCIAALKSWTTTNTPISPTAEVVLLAGKYYQYGSTLFVTSPQTPEMSNLTSTQTAVMSAYDALQAFVPSLSKRVLLARYPSCAWQECSGLAARQFGAFNVLLTIVRLQTGMSIHSYGAYNVGTCAAAILLVHYVSERMMGSIRGSALSAAEVAAFVTFFWMMVQREKYVSELLPSSDVARALMLILFLVPDTPGVMPEAGIMHPTQGGPYYPDKPYMVVS